MRSFLICLCILFSTSNAGLWKDFTKWGKNVWGNIVDISEDAVDGVTKVYHTSVGGIVTGYEATTGWFNNDVKDFFEDDVPGWYMDNVHEIFTEEIPDVFSRDIPDLIETIVRWEGEVLGEALEWTREESSKFRNDIKNAFVGTKDAFKNIASKLTEAWKDAKEWTEEFFESMRIRELWESVKDEILEKSQNIMEDIKPHARRIVEVFKQYEDALDEFKADIDRIHQRRRSLSEASEEERRMLDQELQDALDPFHRTFESMKKTIFGGLGLDYDTDITTIGWQSGISASYWIFTGSGWFGGLRRTFRSSEGHFKTENAQLAAAFIGLGGEFEGGKDTPGTDELDLPFSEGGVTLILGFNALPEDFNGWGVTISAGASFYLGLGIEAYWGLDNKGFRFLGLGLNFKTGGTSFKLELSATIGYTWVYGKKEKNLPIDTPEQPPIDTPEQPKYVHLPPVDFRSTHTNTADWERTFDRRGWSEINDNHLITGFARAGAGGGHNAIHHLLQVTYAASNPGACGVTDWKDFGKQRWRECPPSMGLLGLFREGNSETVNDITKGRCCTGVTKQCRDVDITTSFDNPGWSGCAHGYAMTAFYTSGSDHFALHSIERLRCCKIAPITPRHKFELQGAVGNEWIELIDGPHTSLHQLTRDWTTFYTNRKALTYRVVDSNFLLAEGHNAGVASNCRSLGCDTSGGVADCQYHCLSTSGCNVFNFCPEGATCTSGLNRCCRRQCDSTESNDLLLVDEWGGWDVYILEANSHVNFRTDTDFTTATLPEWTKNLLVYGSSKRIWKRYLAIKYEIEFGKTYEFQLRGRGSPVVTIHDPYFTETIILTDDWQEFMSAVDTLRITCENCDGDMDVFFQSPSYTDIRIQQTLADEWRCGKSNESYKCQTVQEGIFLWTADYMIDFSAVDPFDFTLAESHLSGVRVASTDCSDLGCRTVDSVSVCKAISLADSECNVFNFCPPEASCESTNACCRKRCESAAPSDLKLVNDFGGWDVYTRNKYSNFMLVEAHNAGWASNCRNLGCDTFEGGVAKCKDHCLSTSGCNVFNFCPEGATCNSGLNRCCRRQCDSTEFNDLLLVNAWGGWDVYILQRIRTTND